MPGIYIHIPFCRSRCIYCDFFSTTLPPAWQLPYVRALIRELELRTAGQTRESAPCPSIYLGGGTPSLLTPEALSLLTSHLSPLTSGQTRESTPTPSPLAPCSSPLAPEFTLEANPDDVTPQWIAALRQTPVNRISMGVQSLNDSVLRTLRRRHTASQALRAIRLLQEAGYTNLSLDLIYGLPGQTLQMFEQDVRQVLALGIPHLSAYALQFEPGTALTHMKEAGRIREADEELSLACYQRLIDLTQAAGLEHYEISNFARPGFRSRHNSAYWTDQPYIGLGAGAHSYDGHSTRSFNCEDIKQYIAAINDSRLPQTTETLSPTDRYNERVMLRLRTREGLDLAALGRDFGPDRLAYLRRMAAPHLRRGTLQIKTGEALCLTRQGLFVSDTIISDLFL